jgi:hypothetical protein
MNALMHKIEVDDSVTVETVEQLRSAMNALTDALYDNLAETYVVERLREHFTDGSIGTTIRIRVAEAA